MNNTNNTKYCIENNNYNNIKLNNLKNNKIDNKVLNNNKSYYSNHNKEKTKKKKVNYDDDFNITSMLIKSEPYYDPFKMCYCLKEIGINKCLVLFENFLSIPFNNVFRTKVSSDITLYLTNMKDTAEKAYYFKG